MPTRLIVVSSDLDWLMTLTDTLRPLNATTKTSLASALATAQHEPTLIVTAPVETAALLDQPELLGRSPALVVGVADPVDVDVLRRATRAGLRDVVDARKLAALAPALDAIHARATQQAPVASGPQGGAPGKVVLVTSAKAGQGSTTVAVNLAVTLAGRGTTALVEGDPRFGDVLNALGYRQGHTELVPAQLLGDHWLDRWLYRHPSGVVAVLPRQDSVDTLDPDEAVQAIDALQRVCHHIVIDVPFWVLERYRLHRVADAVLVVSTDAERDLQRVPMLVRSLGLATEQARLVITDQSPRRTPRSGRLQELTGLVPATAIPEASEEASRAMDDGEPLLDASRRDPDLVQAFDELAGEVEDLTRS